MKSLLLGATGQIGYALIACGALDDHGQWREPVRSDTSLFPTRALCKVCRSKVLAALQQIEIRGQLPRDPHASDTQRWDRHRALCRHQWVVYAKTPMSGPAAVFDFLLRYTHRTAIGHERLLAMTSSHVKIRVRQHKAGGKRVVAIPGEWFIGRILAHVLPAGFKRIRHCGLLAPAVKRERLARVPPLLPMPQSNPIAQESAERFTRRAGALQFEKLRTLRRRPLSTYADDLVSSNVDRARARSALAKLCPTMMTSSAVPANRLRTAFPREPTRCGERTANGRIPRCAGAGQKPRYRSGLYKDRAQCECRLLGCHQSAHQQPERQASNLQYP